ncbi:MAG TPA: hypothetical protein VN666_18875 [Nitrospira sp.]|nr:hypothetical protein [Nitrospira sp.]
MKLYKTLDHCAPEHERCVFWDNLAIEIQRPFEGPPVLSEKDRQRAAFLEAECFE